MTATDARRVLGSPGRRAARAGARSERLGPSDLLRKMFDVDLVSVRQGERVIEQPAELTHVAGEGMAGERPPPASREARNAAGWGRELAQEVADEHVQIAIAVAQRRDAQLHTVEAHP